MVWGPDSEAKVMGTQRERLRERRLWLESRERLKLPCKLQDRCRGSWWWADTLGTGEVFWGLGETLR